MSRARPSLVASLTLAGVFVLGALSGIAGAGFLAHRHLRSVFDGTPEQVDTHVTLAMLEAALHLSSDERQSVRAVLEKHEPEHTRLRETIEPGLTTLREEERSEIRALLTAEQQARFDAALLRIDGRRKRIARLLDH
jgi:hypothetical protein